jgi:hypothetical protein
VSGTLNEALPMPANVGCIHLPFLIIAMPHTDCSLFEDLEAALQTGLSEKRTAPPRRVTDLFPSDADRLDEKQISAFDDVPVQLIEKIETRTSQKLSSQRPATASILTGS